MNAQLLRANLLAVAVTSAVMLAVHVRHAWRRDTARSALQRLLFDRSSSAKCDLALWATTLIPVGLFHTFLKLVTVPGIAALGLAAAIPAGSRLGVLGNAATSLPHGLQLLAWFVAFDFAAYWSHRLHHSVPVLWRMHEVHHSATELNIVTGTRVALAERACNGLVTSVFVTLLLGLPRPTDVFWLLTVRRVVELVQHSDLPWDYGPLGELVASPRFHRLHHSTHFEDRDQNFGNLFTFWDSAFSTTSTRYRHEGSAVADTVTIGLGEGAATMTWQRSLLIGTLPTIGIQTLGSRILHGRVTRSSKPIDVSPASSQPLRSETGPLGPPQPEEGP